MNTTLFFRLALGSVTLAAALGACGDSSWDGFAGEEPQFELPDDRGGEPQEPVPPAAPLALTAPAASPSFVFVANTTRGTLAKIALDGAAVRIATLRVGAFPTQVVASSTEDVALVLNAGSDTVSVVEAAPIGLQDQVRTVDVTPACNALSLSPDSRMAFAWYDSRSASAGAPVGSLSEVSVFPLRGDVEQAWQISVGVGIREVVFSEDGDRAYIVSEEGVSTLVLDELEGDAFVPPVSLRLPDEPAPTFNSVEVVLDRTRDLAIVRVPDRAIARVVDLASGQIVDTMLPAVPTSVDVVGATGVAVFGFASSESFGLLDLTLEGEDALSEVEIGFRPDRVQVSPDGLRALAFSSDVEASEVALISLATTAVTRVVVRKGVESAVFSPDGTLVILRHTKAPGEPVAGEPEDAIIRKSHAVSVVTIATGTAKLVRLDAVASQVAFSQAQDVVFVLATDADRAVHEMLRIDLATLRTETFRFDRLPEHIGVVPGAGTLFVSQTHPLGRIAFVDIATGAVREVTGFELNGLID